MKIEEPQAIDSAMHEARHSTQFSEALPEECFTVQEVKQHSGWWEIHIQMQWHTLNHEEIQGKNLPLQRWLHKISINGENGEVIGAIFDVEE